MTCRSVSASPPCLVRNQRKSWWGWSGGREVVGVEYERVMKFLGKGEDEFHDEIKLQSMERKRQLKVKSIKIRL